MVRQARVFLMCEHQIDVVGKDGALQFEGDSTEPPLPRDQMA
jgi:hypothetical protein